MISYLKCHLDKTYLDIFYSLRIKTKNFNLRGLITICFKALLSCIDFKKQLVFIYFFYLDTN